MNSGTIIVGAISIAVCVAPFALMIRGMKRKEKYLLQSIFAIANNDNCKISQHEVSEEFAIGIDEKANQLFFFRKTSENESAQHINLSEIKSCKVIKMGQSFNNKNESDKTIDRLELQFSFLDKNNPDNSLVFYNADESAQPSGEIIIIEKWAKIVNDKLMSQQKR